MNTEQAQIQAAENQIDNRDLAAKWIKDLRSDPSWIRKPSGDRKNSGQQEN